MNLKIGRGVLTPPLGLLANTVGRGRPTVLGRFRGAMREFIRGILTAALSFGRGRSDRRSGTGPWRSVKPDARPRRRRRTAVPSPCGRGFG
jgi:hypothetical protein